MKKLSAYFTRGELALFALISWLRDPYKGDRSEVAVGHPGLGQLMLMVISFLMFLVNDLYGFISWRRMEERQAAGI